MHDVEIVAAPSSTTEQNSNSQPASIGTPSMEQTPRSSRSSSFVNIDQTGLMTTSEHNGQQSSVIYIKKFNFKRNFSLLPKFIRCDKHLRKKNII